MIELEARFDHIVKTLFEFMDADNDKNIVLDEFVQHYFKLQRNLHEEIEEIGFRINDQTTRAKQIEEKLEELRKAEGYTQKRHFKFTDRLIMVGSILSVHVIDARDVKPSSGRGLATSQIRLQIEGQSSKTRQVERSNEPVWDEVLIFDIKSGSEPLKVTL